jgi:hypothetical protein
MRYDITSSVASMRPRSGVSLASAVAGTSLKRKPVQPAAPRQPVRAPGAVAPSTTAAPAPAAPGGFDADPILQQIRALGQRNVTGAEGAELAGRKQAMIGFGYDPALASLYPDQQTAEAARQNPFSIATELVRQHGERWRGLEEDAGGRNLLVSGHHDRDVADESRRFLAEQVGAQQTLEGQLGSLATATLAARQAAADRELTGAQDAYTRALLTGGYADPAAAAPKNGAVVASPPATKAPHPQAALPLPKKFIPGVTDFPRPRPRPRPRFIAGVTDFGR